MGIYVNWFSMSSIQCRLWVLALIAGIILGFSACSTFRYWSAQPVDWQFIQRAGGIRIGEPVTKEGKVLLPVECDLSGLQEITTQPTQMNSALVVQKVNARRVGAVIILQVISQLLEKGEAVETVHYADLSDIPAGTYEVYYERAGVTEQHLGQITLRSSGN